MDLLAERGRRVSVDELNTTRLLAHARKQAVQRKFDDMLIVDVDAHHYENEHYSEILPYMENDVFKQWTMGGRGQTDRGSIVPTKAGFIQDMGGRLRRYPLRRSEKTEPGKFRDVQLGERWMDAMGVDYSCLFPTGMLNIGMHPSREMEVELCWAYNRWVTEKVLPASGRRLPPGRDLRPPQGRRRLHGDDRPQRHGRQRQPLHEVLSRRRRARPGPV